MEKLEKFKKNLNDTIVGLEGKRKKNKKTAFKIYMLISAFSALITFLVAISDNIPFFKNCTEEIQFIIKVIILICSGFSTLLAAWEGFYNHKQLWIN